MSRSTVSSHADVPWPGEFKEKTDFTIPSQGLNDDTLVADGHDPQMLNISRYINDEVNLEVAIRERLATTIEGRIQWALHMLEALSHANAQHDQPSDGDDFQDAALDALEALEAPASFIFDTGLPEERSPSPSCSSAVPCPPPLQRMPKTRSSRTPKPQQQKKHLYIKLPSTTSDNQFAILNCPTCNRTQFTTLQGLLNHARLAHSVEWASHDACIAACAVPIDADSPWWETYEGDGVEVPWGGNVVGLRRLFERAVGVDGTLPMLPLAHTTSDIPLESLATAPSTLLSRTLGLHADSPALAQFLGRAPKRRCIHVYDEDQQVDITTLDRTSSQPSGLIFKELGPSRKPFPVHYPHRNTAREDLDLVVNVDDERGITNTGNISPSAVMSSGTIASRFRIVARVRLEDRSLFLKADRRTQLGINDHYRWILGVTAPSYSLPLSSFLTCITVVPPKTVSPVFLTVHQQPFAVVGTADEPFMAKVIFEWVGGGKMEVEHWVELDQSKSHTSVLGSEQLLDIELDRSAPLLPVPKGSPPPLPPLDRPLTLDSPLHATPQTRPEHDTTTNEPYYGLILRSLLPRVPMTAKDVKPKMTTQVPYKLVPSPTHLLALVPGRRKAIEWGRACALHELYVDHMASVPPGQRTMLTVGDVYMFLEDSAHFPRPSQSTPGPSSVLRKKGREKDGSPVPGEESCPTCGIKKRLHPGYDNKSEDGVASWTCGVVPTTEQRYGARFPLTNLTKVLVWPDGCEQAVLGPPLPPASRVHTTNRMFTLFPPYQHKPRDLTTLNPPELILAVHTVVSKLGLPSFPDLAPYGENPTILPNIEVTERCLAPAALLTATLKPFISTLLRSAIEIAKRDATTIVSATKNDRGKRMKKLTFVLTPGHVLRGLRFQPSNNLKVVPSFVRTDRTMNEHSRSKELSALCLTQLGVPLDFGKVKLTRLGASGAVYSEQATAALYADK